MPEHTIEDLGRQQWSLVVGRDGVVEARRTIPYDGVLYYSTADRANRAGKRSEYQLEVEEVVDRYVELSATDCSRDELLADVAMLRDRKVNA